jgi:hypothetical protein
MIEYAIQEGERDKRYKSSLGVRWLSIKPIQETGEEAHKRLEEMNTYYARVGRFWRLLNREVPDWTPVD